MADGGSPVKEQAVFSALTKYKKEIQEFITLVESSFLIAVKISSCNATSPKAFSSASIDFERTTSVIFYKTVFKIELLKYFIENGTLPADIGIGKSSLLQSLQLLASYLNEAELTKNKSVLEAFASDVGISEGNWASILAAHAVKKLSPADITILSDGYARCKECPCNINCRQKLFYGDTSMGNESVWHGSVDIICELGGVVIQIQPEGEESTEFASLLEVKKETITPYQEQIFAEAIVASFAMKGAAPLIAISKKEVQLFLYIPENDILLEGVPFTLTEDFENGSLDINGILALWLILNYHSFKEDLDNSIDSSAMPKSHFKELAGDKLTVYETDVRLHGCSQVSRKRKSTADYAGFLIKKKKWQHHSKK